MAEINELQKLKDEYPEFFKNTSSEVIDFILSEETSSKIADICKKNGVAEPENVEGVAYRITLVLLERLPKENLAYTLEKGVGLSPEIAKKISDEAVQEIFSAAPLSKPSESTPSPSPRETVSKAKPLEVPKKPDAYKEPIE